MKRLLHPLYMAYCKSLEILVSKKYIALIIGAWLLMHGYLTGTEFLPIILGVLGIQGFLDNKTPPRNFNESDTSVPGGAAG